jgi:hypothetical protein
MAASTRGRRPDPAGLAQAPPFVHPDYLAIVARVRMDQYVQLLSVRRSTVTSNAGVSVADCTEHARARVPWWDGSTVADTLTDRGADPLSRSYLSSCPAGIDWFVSPRRHRNRGKVFRAAYAQPLAPTDLADRWPAGSRVGGPCAPVRLRKPAVP